MSRGPHPTDGRLFGPEALPLLHMAAEEIVWLLGRRYPLEGVVGFVGSRHQLHARQRLALARSLSSEATRLSRQAREVSPETLRDETLHIDGFNLIITLEVALAGGALLVGHDGALRDLAGLRGTYRIHAHTDRALAFVGATLAELRPARVLWYLDRPVSNSGRLRERILAEAAQGSQQGSPTWSPRESPKGSLKGFQTGVRREPLPQEVFVVPDPDRELVCLHNVASSDAAVLDRAASWVNLAAEVVRRHVPGAWLVPMGPGAEGPPALSMKRPAE